MTKLIGIDYGEKKIGIALSDDDGAVAFPKEIIKNDDELVSYIADLAEKENISRIVIGQSTNYHGEDNPIMKRIHQFKEALEERLSVPIDFEVEFLTSAEAKRQPRESDILRSRKPKVRRHVDASAAAIILQSFLDKNRSNI
ncbi:Holliday junction resolvase RuvX [Patescibacteria group bacterium]|nr:Holliday junction resolvase RuvX [Patescibacteria group bacterium]